MSGTLIFRQLFKFPALLHALFGWAVSMAFAYAGSGGDPSRYLWVSIALLPFAVLSPCAAIGFEIVGYPVTRRFLWRLCASYLTLMLAFANVYFLMILVEPTWFEGIHSPWTQLQGLEGRRLYMGDVWYTAVDCIHFSCVTIATVGFGDMRPVHWLAKVVTDLEILLGLALVIIGFGRYFQELGASELKGGR